jgi:hypothetical protein
MMDDDLAGRTMTGAEPSAPADQFLDLGRDFADKSLTRHQIHPERTGIMVSQASAEMTRMCSEENLQRSPRQYIIQIPDQARSSAPLPGPECLNRPTSHQG